jgi:DnaK suppressor protein
MNQSQIVAELEQEAQRLEAEIAELEEQDPSKDEFRDINNTDDDDAQESEAFSRIQARIDASRAHQVKVNKALEKVKAGTYGKCERCGKDIAPARLEAMPWATYDVECEEIIESGRR